ncbi:MAG: hypothetical protein HY983_01575 [Candidatus Magasanikbacteria bacterium]|nr:hypothetical protein [Candidatus Magasanikbacteria bacterium]
MKTSKKAESVATQAKILLREFENRLEEIHQEALALVRTHEQKRIAAVRQSIRGI